MLSKQQSFYVVLTGKKEVPRLPSAPNKQFPATLVAWLVFNMQVMFTVVLSSPSHLMACCGRFDLLELSLREVMPQLCLCR